MIDPLLSRAASSIEEPAESAGGLALLVVELEAIPVQRRAKALANRRYWRRDLIRELLRLAEAALLQDSARAVSLADLALGFAGRLDSGDVVASRAIIESRLLIGAALREMRKLEMAAAAFARTSVLLDRPGDEARLLRGLGLVRWEQGRMSEAAALLQGGASLFGEAASPEEEMACLALLGLLRSELGQAERAAGLLRQAQPVVEERGTPRLRLAVLLALAECLARLGQRQESRGALEHAYQVDPRAADREEVWLATTWAEGRVAAWTGSPYEAEQSLTLVRAKLFAVDRPAEASLVTLDLAVVFAKTGRVQEIGPLIEAVASRFEGRFELDLALPTLRGFPEVIGLPGFEVDLEASRSARFLRQRFRACGVRLEPLPFP